MEDEDFEDLGDISLSNEDGRTGGSTGAYSFPGAAPSVITSAGRRRRDVRSANAVRAG